MTNENMKFWESVKKTDPNRVKPITGKQYKGNSPQPYYLVERMTDAFGMCGIGWGLNIINERMERLTDTDVLHVAVVELWYVYGDKKGSITQIGQTKACYKTSSGSLLVDEDAPKKSITDAMTKCMSYLGFAGDIFSGQWDDSKYVQQLTKEFNHPDGKGDLPQPRMPELKSVQLSDFDEESQQFLKDTAIEMIAAVEQGASVDAYNLSLTLTNDEKLVIWTLLDSKTRTALQKYSQELQRKAA